MTDFLDLIPWETEPNQKKSEPFVIEWGEGSFTIPRYGYMTVNELSQIQAVDPKNAVYRLTCIASVKLSKALKDSDDENHHLNSRQCYALLTQLYAKNCGAQVNVSSNEEEISILYADIISPYLEETKQLTDLIAIRSVTVMMQRINKDWSDDKTLIMPPDLFQSVHKNQQEEEHQDASDPAQQLKDLEEALGKLRGASNYIQTDQAGQEPIGNADASGQAAQNSIESNSAACQGDTSSKRLKSASKPKKPGFTMKS
jgi:hypothetical protein